MVPPHEVRVERSCRLRGLLGSERLDVNSFHHQAIEQVGTGLHAVAWSPDGVIEAVETDGQHFALGVQWHAESLVHDTPHAALFAAVVGAASAHGEDDGLAAYFPVPALAHLEGPYVKLVREALHAPVATSYAAYVSVMPRRPS
ncbi:MAG TPA: gamma-glutamyl-gamma-aminobutyrate hydrolase family protein [Solirubrobacteraceae bacterium]